MTRSSTLAGRRGVRRGGATDRAVTRSAYRLHPGRSDDTIVAIDGLRGALKRIARAGRSPMPEPYEVCDQGLQDQVLAALMADIHTIADVRMMPDRL